MWPFVGVALRPAGLVDSHAPHGGVVGRRPGLRDRPVQHVPEPAVGLAERLGNRLDGRPPHAGGEHLRLEERREVRVRSDLPWHEHCPDAVLGAVGPGHGAVDVGHELPDVEAAPGPLPRIVDAAAPAALGAGHRLSAHAGDPHVQLVGAALDLLEPGLGDLPRVVETHRPLEERCEH